MRRKRMKLGIAATLCVILIAQTGAAQDRQPPRGFTPYGGNGLGVGLGIGLGAAVLGGILATQGRAEPRRPTLVEGGPGEGRVHTIYTTNHPRHLPIRTQRIPRVQRPTHLPTQAQTQAPPPPPPPNPNIVVPARTEVRYVPDEILVVTRGGNPARLRRLERLFGLTSLDSVHIDLLDADIGRYRLRPGASVAVTLTGLRAQRAIDGAEPNYLFALQEDATDSSSPPAPDAAPSDAAGPEAADAAPLQYAVTSLHLDAAHKVANGDDVLVAIIDSGVDETDPELQGMVAQRFDAVGGTFAPQAHGTAMGGAIVAHRTLIGAAPKARLIAIRAFSGTKQSANGTGFDILRGLDFAATHGARIVNLSFAGPRDLLLEQALVAAHTRGITSFAAAGNGGPTAQPLYPAAGPGVIAVTATDADGKPFAMANRGGYVAMAAPGVDIVAPGLGGSVQMTSGTSIATAEASGVAALILERKGTAGPDEVRRLLTSTARPLSSEPAAGGAGLIDAAAAVAAAK